MLKQVVDIVNTGLYRVNIAPVYPTLAVHVVLQYKLFRITQWPLLRHHIGTILLEHRVEMTVSWHVLRSAWDDRWIINLRYSLFERRNIILWAYTPRNEQVYQYDRTGVGVCLHTARLASLWSCSHVPSVITPQNRRLQVNCVPCH
jgi:hypothetical protein